MPLTSRYQVAAANLDNGRESKVARITKNTRAVEEIKNKLLNSESNVPVLTEAFLKYNSVIDENEEITSEDLSKFAEILMNYDLP